MEATDMSYDDGNIYEDEDFWAKDDDDRLKSK